MSVPDPTSYIDAILLIPYFLKRQTGDEKGTGKRKEGMHFFAFVRELALKSWSAFLTLLS
jgi:hypothetical protein